MKQLKSNKNKTKKDNFTVEAHWSGVYPCLCWGSWTLKINGKDYSKFIPINKVDKPMDTLGSYDQWYFDEEYLEQWKKVKDGLDEKEWINANDSWLSKITRLRTLKKAIFKAFQANDFRHGCCGGCI